MEAIRHTHRRPGREPLGDCPACDREWLTTSPTFADLPSRTVGTIAVIRAHIGEYTRTPVSYDTSVPGRVELSCAVGQSRFVAAITSDGAPELSSWLLRDPARETSYGHDLLPFYSHMRDCASNNQPADQAVEAADADGWPHRDDGTDMCPTCVGKTEQL